MKVSKKALEQIVKEEVVAHVRSLLEAPKGADVVDADDEKKGKEKKDGKGEEAPTKPAPGPKAPKQQSDKPAEKKPEKELPVGKEPEEPEEVPEDPKAAGEGEKGEEDAVEDSDEVTGGKIADQINGKTVQSITMEPESKLLPGAQEVTLTFREMPDPLKILITKSGQVKFHFRGLHNTLGEAAPAMPAAQAGAAPSAASPIVKKTNHPSSFSMTNDEYLSWVKNPPASIQVVSAQGGKPIATMDQKAVRWAMSKAKFMRGLSKGVDSETEYWVAPVIRK